MKNYEICILLKSGNIDIVGPLIKLEVINGKIHIDNGTGHDHDYLIEDIKSFHLQKEQ